MNNIKKENQIDKNNINRTKKIFKSLGYTLIIYLISTYGLLSLIGLIFKDLSAEQTDFWLIASLILGLIFTVIYCTLTILDELKNIKRF